MRELSCIRDAVHLSRPVLDHSEDISLIDYIRLRVTIQPDNIQAVHSSVTGVEN